MVKLVIMTHFIDKNLKYHAMTMPRIDFTLKIFYVLCCSKSNLYVIPKSVLSVAQVCLEFDLHSTYPIYFFKAIHKMFFFKSEGRNVY